jgi:hypothetical protein
MKYDLPTNTTTCKQNQLHQGAPLFNFFVRFFALWLSFSLVFSFDIAAEKESLLHYDELIVKDPIGRGVRIKRNQNKQTSKRQTKKQTKK